MKLKCPICKKEFNRSPSQIKGKFNFCSKKCFGIAHHMRHDPDGKYMHTRKVKRYCINCDREFYVYQYRIDNGGGKYCSKACYHNDRRRKITENKIDTNW
jgi:hypothetical protein